MREIEINTLFEEAYQLLVQLVKTQSYSREENITAELIEAFLKEYGYMPNRLKNNVWVKSSDFTEGRKTILLNSHHDTVRPSKEWTEDPFAGIERNGKLIGLGSNDAGGCLVSLLAAFIYLDNIQNRAYNLIFAASAEEEVSGTDGAELLMNEIGGMVDFGIVGEPTKMEMAVAEKGLMVLDCCVYGKAGHAARNEGVNAIYEALPVIEWFKNYQFPKISDVLGPVKMTVSMIQAGKQHNVVPGHCSFVVDVRMNGRYTNKEAYEIIKQNAGCEVEARSFRLNSSQVALDHPVIKKGIDLGYKYYGSPTMSDQVFMTMFPTVKIGPGDSARSHTADEYIYKEEIKEGIEKYIALLEGAEL